MIYKNAMKYNIAQGDILRLSKSEVEKYFDIESDEESLLLMVVSNTCDIKNRNISNISVAPIENLNITLFKSAETKKQEKLDEKGNLNNDSRNSIKNSVKNTAKTIMKYNHKKLFYLPKDETRGINENCVVMTEWIKNVPLSNVQKIIKSNRICTLKNPWREKLGWHIGNFYNRIALKDFSIKHEEAITNSAEITAKQVIQKIT